jgi:hypothetical protein
LIHQKIEADYRRRHPMRAAEEYVLRHRQAGLQERWGHKREGTPETLEQAARVRQGALARMFAGGHLSIDQLAFASEIRAIAERIGRDVAIGTVSLETRVDNSQGPGAPFEESLGRVRREVAYSRWRAALRRPGPVLAMVVDDIAVRTVAQHYRMRDAKARALLVDALDAWPEWCRDARERVNEVDLKLVAARLG